MNLIFFSSTLDLVDGVFLWCISVGALFTSGRVRFFTLHEISMKMVVINFTFEIDGRLPKDEDDYVHDLEQNLDKSDHRQNHNRKDYCPHFRNAL